MGTLNKRRFNSARDRFNLPEGRWWGGSTHRGNVVYLHIMRWPNDSILLPSIDRKLTAHSLLTGGTVTVTQTVEGIRVTVPTDDRDPVDTIVKLQFDKPVTDVAPIVTGDSRAVSKKMENR